MQLKIALIAEEAAGVHALRMVSERGHRVVAAFSDSPEGGMGASVRALAGELGVPVRPAAEVRDPGLSAELTAVGVDLLLNVHSLHVLDAAVLDAPILGSYNLHPGPLPECAGLHAPGWALYEGHALHGVTLHRMTAVVDEGPIAFIDRFPVAGLKSALELMSECVRRGLPLLDRLLELAARGAPIPAEPQDLGRRRWFGSGPPQGGLLDWGRPASQVAGFVGACDYGPFPSPWSFPRCRAADGEIAIVAAEATLEAADATPGTVAVAENDGVLVAAADAWVRVARIETASGDRVPAAAALRPGDRLLSLEREPGGSRR